MWLTCGPTVASELTQHSALAIQAEHLQHLHNLPAVMKAASYRRDLLKVNNP